MWIVVGHKHKYVPKPDGLELTKACPKCRGPRLFIEVVPKEYFTIFWVPLFATDTKDPVLECTGCHDKYRISEADYRLGMQQRAKAPAARAEQAPPPARAEPERVVVNCPACKAGARVPRMADVIRVTCPKCSRKFEVADGAVR